MKVSQVLTSIVLGLATGIFFQAIDKPIQSTILSLLRQIVVLVPAVLILGAVGELGIERCVEIIVNCYK